MEYTDQEGVTGYSSSSVFQPAEPPDGLGVVFTGGRNQTTWPKG
jgi:hypothetical protein